MTYLSGVFEKEVREEARHGLLAPLYVDRDKGLMLFSHHPQGLVWQVSVYIYLYPYPSIYLSLKSPPCRRCRRS